MEETVVHLRRAISQYLRRYHHFSSAKAAQLRKMVSSIMDVRPTLRPPLWMLRTVKRGRRPTTAQMRAFVQHFLSDVWARRYWASSRPFLLQLARDLRIRT